MNEELNPGDKVKIKDVSLAPIHKPWAGCIVTVEGLEGDIFVTIKEFRKRDIGTGIPRDRLEKVSYTLPEHLFEI